MKSDWALRTQDRDGNDHGSTNSGRAIELIKGPEKKKREQKKKTSLYLNF